MRVIYQENLAVAVRVIARRRAFSGDVAVGFDYDKPPVAADAARVRTAAMIRNLCYKSVRYALRGSGLSNIKRGQT